MGNFYANVTLRPAEMDTVVQTLVSLRRRTFVAPAVAGSTVIYDEAAEGGGQRELGRLAAELSRRHACAALAVLVADDDVLWYALYRAGRLDHEYDSNPSYDSGYVFEHERHADLARLLGLPEIAVATGYGYVDAGELPEGLAEGDLRRVG
jgi:hypothetical protein